MLEFHNMRHLRHLTIANSVELHIDNEDVLLFGVTDRVHFRCRCAVECSYLALGLKIVLLHPLRLPVGGFNGQPKRLK